LFTIPGINRLQFCYLSLKKREADASFILKTIYMVSLLFSGLWLINYCLFCTALWHPYKADKVYDLSCNRSNEALQEHTQRVSQSNRQKWNLWPDIVSDRDEIDGETMYGFEAGMEAIWKHQHPPDCKNAKFIISGGFESGFGSEFHVLGEGLAMAMNLGRVYVMFPDRGNSGLSDKMNSLNRFQVDTEYCRKQGKLSLECYFEPWSSCTIEDALRGATLQQLRVDGLHLFDKEIQDLAANNNDTAHAYIAQLGDYSDTLPTALAPIFKCSPMDPSKYRYWWRSLSAAYLMRPNAPTRALIQQHRQDQEFSFNMNTQACVSVHIRRGDKHLEMDLIADEKVFFEGAQRLWQGLRDEGRDPVVKSQVKAVMMLGSEDPGAFDHAIEWSKENNFEVKFTNLFDRSAVSTGLNNSEQQKARAANAFKHHELEYFNMILTLDGHLRCSAFVCTMRSNFCRVIDELRATVGHKANRHYADYTCNPPCIDDPKSGIDWRRRN
jgi:hypothetical protein